MNRKIIAAALGTAAVLGVTVLFLVKNTAPSLDLGGDSRVATPPPPNLRTDQMQPVGQEEANRRATALTDRRETDQKLEQQKQAAKPYASVDPALIVEQEGAMKLALDERMKQLAKPKDFDENALTPAPAPPAAPAAPQGPTPGELAIRQQLGQMQAQQGEQQAKMAQQLAQMQMKVSAAEKVEPFATTYLKLGEPKELVIQPPPPRPAPKPFGGVTYRDALLAQNGAQYYARLTIAFNSDDPRGLPVFAKITDIRPDGTPGALNDAVLQGRVTYSEEQAAITFTTLTVGDRPPTPTQAMAITMPEARPGVARDIDHHYLERYGALTLAGLIQGIGQAGTLLINNSRNVTYGEGSVTSTGQSVPKYQIGMAALQPVGQNLSSAMQRVFNKPTTIASPVDLPIAVVFLQPVHMQLTPSDVERYRYTASR